MNKQLTLVDALQSKQSPIANMQWHLVCDCCGRDHGFASGYPITVICFECEQPVEYKRNEEFIGTTTSTESSPSIAGDHGTEFVSKMLLTTIRGE